MDVEELMRKKKKNYGKMRALLMIGRKKILKEIQERMDGWQLESFKESYEHKKNNGISLFKKNMSK